MSETTEDRSTESGGPKLKFPHPMAMIFYILLLAAVMTLIVPSGSYEREEVGGRERVIPGSFSHTETEGGFSIGGAIDFLFSIIVTIPRGLVDAGPYLFIVFIAGGLFHVMRESNALENTVATIVRKVGTDNRGMMIWIGTYIYGLFGVAVGFENNIALVPVAMIVAATLGYSNVVGASMAIGGIGVGFALSPINPYTVGVSHDIAGLPLFSGAALRTLLTIAALALLALYINHWIVKRDDAGLDDAEGRGLGDLSDYKMTRTDKIIMGAFAFGILVIAVCSYLAGAGMLGRSWYISEIAAVFLIISMIAGFASNMSVSEYIETMVEGASKVVGGALIIGLAASISIMLEDGQIIDTIIHGLSSIAQGVPLMVLGPVMSVLQGIFNFFVPSGSGQALVTMPILIPLAEITGMSKQLMILSFQVGDGLTNLIIPTAGGTLAMLALAGVPYPKWVGIMAPFMAVLYVLCWVFLVIGHYIGY